MPRIAPRFHGLKQSKIRASWHKNNLYILAKTKAQNVRTDTYFQQKWRAKASTRSYHGEQLRERQWENMFRPRINSVVEMDHEYLAANDGSEQAAGRGSGIQRALVKPGEDDLPAQIPYMHMVYAPIERRLDNAIFRALFASSARQARQFVVHGYVKVNGKKMKHPGYLLNPGDMFQVDPERVMFATGHIGTKTSRRQRRKLTDKPKSASAASADETSEEAERSEVDEAEVVESEEADEAQESTPSTTPLSGSEGKGSSKSILRSPNAVLAIAREMALDSRGVCSPERPGLIHKLQRHVKAVLSSSTLASSESAADVDVQMREITRALEENKSSMIAPPSVQNEEEAGNRKFQVNKFDRNALQAALTELSENPSDGTKPYGTPWRPRDYMSAFAFIPRFLEVNQNICSAVYLRHPVARPGLAEVPSPFGGDTHQLAFNWYLRRR